MHKRQGKVNNMLWEMCVNYIIYSRPYIYQHIYTGTYIIHIYIFLTKRTAKTTIDMTCFSCYRFKRSHEKLLSLILSNCRKTSNARMRKQCAQLREQLSSHFQCEGSGVISHFFSGIELKALP